MIAVLTTHAYQTMIFFLNGLEGENRTPIIYP